MSQINTAGFAGVLNIPMYQLPYTIPYDGVHQYRFVPGNSESPIAQPVNLNTSYVYQSPAVFAETMVYSSLMARLNFTQADFLSVGPGLNGISGNGFGSLTTQNPTMYMQNMCFPTLYGIGDLFQPGNMRSGISYAWTPLVANSAVPSMNVRPSTNQGMVTASNSNFNSNQFPLTCGRIAITLFEDIDIEGIPIPLQVATTTGLGSLFCGPNFNLVFQADLGLGGIPTNGFINLPDGTSGAQNLHPPGVWINAAPLAGTNYVWIEYEAQIYFCTVAANYDVTLQGFDPIAAPLFWFQFQFDNPTLNAFISSQNFFAYGQPNGFIFSCPNGDYFIDKTGSRYWQINLIPGAPNVPAFSTPGFIEGGNSRQFDIAGNLWYLGTTGKTNSTQQPFFSFAANINYQPVILPTYLPPLSGPCWSSCLDRVGGTPGSLNPASNVSIYSDWPESNN